MNIHLLLNLHLTTHLSTHLISHPHDSRTPPHPSPGAAEDTVATAAQLQAAAIADLRSQLSVQTTAAAEAADRLSAQVRHIA
jgi:hypothetical protein